MKFTKLGGTRVSLLGEKPLRRRTNARSARLPHARSPTNNQKRRKPFRRADSSEGYRGLPRRAFGIWLIHSHTHVGRAERSPTSFLQLFSFWQRKKLIKLPIFCDEILSEATEVTSYGMTVGGGGSCANGDLCGIGIFTREINRQNLPYSPTNGNRRFGRTWEYAKQSSVGQE